MGGAGTLRAQRIPASGHLLSAYCSIDLGRGSGHPKESRSLETLRNSSGTLEETSCSTESSFPRTLQATSTVGLAGLQAPQRTRFPAETPCVGRSPFADRVPQVANKDLGAEERSLEKH